MSSPITYVGSAIETIKGGKIEETESQYFDPDQVVGFRQAFSFLSDKDRDIQPEAVLEGTEKEPLCIIKHEVR